MGCLEEPKGRQGTTNPPTEAPSRCPYYAQHARGKDADQDTIRQEPDVRKRSTRNGQCPWTTRTKDVESAGLFRDPHCSGWQMMNTRRTHPKKFLGCSSSRQRRNHKSRPVYGDIYITRTYLKSAAMEIDYPNPATSVAAC